MKLGEWLKKHKKTVINTTVTICILLMVYWLIPWSGELNGADFLFGYTVYIEEGHMYSEGNEEPHNLWQLDKPTAKEIYGFCKSIEKVKSEDTYYDAITGRGEPTVYIHAGSYGYQIDILYVNSGIGEFPVLSVKRTKVSAKLRGTEAIQAIINGEEKSFLRHEYSLLPTEELFEFIELVRSYDGTDGELIAENTNSWRLQNFG